MNKIIKKHYPVIYDEIMKAQNIINQKTGLKVMLTPRIHLNEIEEEITNMFKQMCTSWGVTFEWLCEQEKDDDRPMMRKILWMAAKRNYKSVDYKLLANIIYISDHSSVIKGITKGYQYLENQDDLFLKYYNVVKEFFL